MKINIRQEKGITMIALTIAIVIMIIITGTLIYNAEDSIHIKALTNLYNDIELLREKTLEYYNEYGEIPAEIKYTNVSHLSNVLSKNNDTGDFYVIDLEAMKGITLYYGKDYEKIKNNADTVNDYTDVYIINKESLNIFYVQGITIKENNVSKTYYTDYTEPDETIVDLRYIDGILIPDGYYYIGKQKDSSGNESIVISQNKDDTINETSQVQYIWQKQIADLDKVPDSITLTTEQNADDFLKSVKQHKGYFKNKNKTTNIDVIYLPVTEVEEEDPLEEEKKKIKNIDTSVTDPANAIPAGTKEVIEGDANKGIVIKDAKDNEWTWVEVPKTIFTSVKTLEENEPDRDLSKVPETELYNAIKTDLINYVTTPIDYRQTYHKDEWYASTGSTLVGESTRNLTENQKKLNNGLGLTYYEYRENYEKMLRSIFTNGGFWISKYEIGDATATEKDIVRRNTSGITGEAVSRADQMPYNYVTCSQAQTLVNGMNTDLNKTTSLLFGIQWDLVCKHIDTKMGSEITKADCSSWGNYIDSSLKLNRGKYNTDLISSSSKWKPFNEDTENYVMSGQTQNNTNYYQLLTTGASEQTNKMNIYDFAGNEGEWTLEQREHTTTIRYCAYRGGVFNYGSGSENTATYRAYNGNTFSNITVSPRATIY